MVLGMKGQGMKSSNIGGQAVLEGVMMKNKDTYAVVVRKPDGEIHVDVQEENLPAFVKTCKKIPILRGVVSFVDSHVIGMKTLTYSASFYEEEEGGDTAKEKSGEAAKEESDMAAQGQQGSLSTAATIGTVALSIVLAVIIFFLIPYGISLLFGKVITSVTLLALLEGLIRMVIFIVYVVAISLMEDIRRVYMYHGAEHKCINCIESGRELTVENVRESTRFHKRCGTSFLLIVMIVTILVFALIRADSAILRLVLRLLLIPVIAGISYEFIRLAGNTDNGLVNLLSLPGLWLQRITTKEPDDSMIEVGIASVEAVFDWKEYLAQNASSSGNASSPENAPIVNDTGETTP